MDIMSRLFGKSQPIQQAPQPGQAQQQVQQGQAQPSAQPGGLNNPANAVVPNAAPGTTGSLAAADKGIPKNLDKATLDDFTQIWEPAGKDESGKQLPDPSKFNRPKLDMNKIQETVNKMSFTGNIDPAKAQAALTGDVSALMEILDGVGRNAFQSAFSANESYQGRILDNYDASVNARIPKMVGSLGSQQQIGELNPNLSHPALAPMVKSVRQQFESAYPDASPKEIAAAVNHYFSQTAALLNTNQSESGNGNLATGQNLGNNGQAKRGSVVTDFDGFETLDSVSQNQGQARFN